MRPRLTVGLVLSTVLVVGLVVTGAGPGNDHVTQEPDTPLYAMGEGVRTTSASRLAGGVCLARVSPAQLDRLFVTEPGGVVGADYQRTMELPDGRVLWTFQDAEVRLPSGATTLVHNIGMVQDGTCFSVLMGGSAGAPTSWLFGEHTSPFRRWFWPLGSMIGSDGRIYVYAAEMQERGESYLTHVVPASTFVAAVDPATWNVEWYGRPGDGSAALYGFSIASDESWTYLYAQCHRQFGFDPYIFVLAHDRDCAARVTVGRIPRGSALARPTYWDGRRWQTDPARARSLFATDGGRARPAQVVLHNNQWMSITKVDDWWGKQIVVEQAPRPTGPFAVTRTLSPQPKCPDDCNTYFASWVPGPSDATMIFGLSHNRWDGIPTHVYRPTFGAVTAPPWTPSHADRCNVGHCD